MKNEHLTALRDFGARAVAAPDLEEFLRAASPHFADARRGEILRRALDFALASDEASLDVSFVGLYAALESVLTSFRREGEYEILPREEFARLERDLRSWLKRHPLLEHDAARRGLVYEKTRELNRFPFSNVFGRFCERYGLDLSDLWPLVGRADEWPLMEIRHRLVHGDPFASRPAEAIACARDHLRWTIERMILAALGWPLSRSGVSAEGLARAGAVYTNWRDERAKLA